jgi:predicted ribosome quality control (RQC) complex YloA/Tae2 family protein
MPGIPSPKDRFTSLDTLAVVRELRALERARVDKAYDVTGGGWSLSLRVPGEGRRELLLIPGRYAALLAVAPEHPEELSPFARELRRILTGAGLRGAAEPNGERYLELAFGRADDPDSLLVGLEMFGTGNLTVAHGGRILAVASPRRWAHRTVRVGAEYARPPVRTDPWKLGRAEIASELERSRRDLASTLAARLGLGGPLAEELVARIARDGALPASADPIEVAGLVHTAIADLLAEVGDRPKGFVYAKEGAPLDATPYRSRRWEEVADVGPSERATFSEAAQEYFGSLVPRPPSAEEAAASSERKELERLIEQQGRAIAELGETVESLRSSAEAILTHHPEAQTAVAHARETSSDAGTVEVALGDRTVTLRLDRSPRESAQELYEESKRIAAKLAGAEAALADSREKLARPSRPLPGGPSSNRAAAVAQHRLRWFEKYRWFLTSERVVVIAGRDAPSNDTIVRRHLKPGDFYLHADLHGASSVIVKKPEEVATVTEVTLREAGQWAVAYSKAWRAGLASATAFWVNPDQVSKSAASGEFVPRGAWVIHGTKNFLGDLPLELALGTISYEKEERWTCAPPSAVRALGAVRVLLTPGEERERAAREVELASELGVSRTLLQSLLPAGGITLRRP